MTQLSGQGGNQAASRGSSALVDNIRFQLNLSGMTEKEAEILGVQENCRSNFVKLIGSKANYATATDDHWLRRAEGGILVKAVLDTPMQVKKSKQKKEASIVDPTNPKSVKDLSYRDVFGGGK